MNMTPDSAVAADLFNASLVDREDLTDELAIFKIRYDDGEVPDFKPGQFTTLGLPPDPDEEKPSAVPGRKSKPKLIRRAYSIASSPLQKDVMEFYVVVVPEGKFTPKLWRLKPGDRLFMDRRISGHFTLDGIPDGRDLVCISTGTGLAPFVSMLKTYRGQNRWRKFVVIHGTRLCVDLGYRAELEQIAAEDPSVVYLPTCTREPDGSIWQGMRGRVHHLLQPDAYQKLVGHPLTPDCAHVLLCGNPAMIDQCEADLQARGFVIKDKQHPDGTVHFERYW